MPLAFVDIVGADVVGVDVLGVVAVNVEVFGNVLIVLLIAVFAVVQI